MRTPDISVVTAITERGYLAPMGNGRAEWYMPEDLARFRRITTGHAVVVAAVTFRTITEALGGPLPSRTNIVVGGTEDFLPDVCIGADDFEQALRIARSCDTGEIFVMGDGRFYDAAFRDLTKLYLTIVKDDDPDTLERFPAYSEQFRQVSSEPGTSNGYEYNFEIWERQGGKL